MANLKNTVFTFFIPVSLILSVGVYAGNVPKTKNLIDQSMKDMQFVKGGTYTMGPTNPQFQTGNNTPPHKVTLSSFYISKYNVSYKKYDEYTDLTDQPYIQPTDRTKKWAFWRKPNHPVNLITWYQANAYCGWLAKQTGLPYSLPTEAQWEYVARNNGNESWNFATDDGKQHIGKNFPSYKMITSQKYNAGGALIALPVGSLPCTPQGICGLNGEVNQWVRDWYSPTYYSKSPVSDPQGPKDGTLKVGRSSGPSSDAGFTNNFVRAGVDPHKQRAGFRCVINSTKPISELKAIAEKHLTSQ